MRLIQTDTLNKYTGGNRMEVIVIHHFDDPAKKPSLAGVINWFKNPSSEVSAHYVVSGETIYKFGKETDRMWHARDANAFSIGIEIDPRAEVDPEFADITYKTCGELVRDIRSRRGNIPLKKHSEYVNTSCPGSIDLARIDREANNKEVGDMPVKLNLTGAQVIAHSILGYMDLTGGNSATAGKIDERLKKSWVGRELTNELLAEAFNKPSAMSYRDNLKKVYGELSKLKDDSGLTVSQRQKLENAYTALSELMNESK